MAEIPDIQVLATVLPALVLSQWENLVGKRLLLTEKTTRIPRNEWTLIEISPSGKTAKFQNEIADSQFWTDLDELMVLDVLPVNEALVRARRKIAAFGREAELTLEEFAAYRGVTVNQVRKNLDETRGVCRTSNKAVGIHLGTYLEENFRNHNCRPVRRTRR